MKKTEKQNSILNIDTQFLNNFGIELANYKNFIKNIEKNDSKNYYTAYITEYNLLKLLLKAAADENLTNETQKINARINEIKEILKEQNGITLK